MQIFDSKTTFHYHTIIFIRPSEPCSSIKRNMNDPEVLLMLCAGPAELQASIKEKACRASEM